MQTITKHVQPWTLLAWSLASASQQIAVHFLHVIRRCVRPIDIVDMCTEIYVCLRRCVRRRTEFAGALTHDVNTN
jgi:hypothetical protein